MTLRRLPSLLRRALACLALAASVTAAAQTAADCDTVIATLNSPLTPPAKAPADSAQLSKSPVLWIRQLIDNGFLINDPGVDYPRFPRFCLKVYNWGDRTFNSYDPEYVVGTGKNWKLQAKNYDWMQLYSLVFSRNERFRVRSHAFADVGAYLSFMAVSIGYTWNARDLLGIARKGNRTNFNVNFTCALFTLDFTHQTTSGGARISEFITKDGPLDLTNRELNDIHNTTTYLTGFYIFNHNHYSHAAAYCFSKYQLRNAGSWLLGINLLSQDIDINFENDLDRQKLEKYDIPLAYSFSYDDYTVQGGYGYNWAIKPRTWLINATAIFGAGYKHSYIVDMNRKRDYFALDGTAMFSVVYNHRALFCSLQGKAYGSLYPTKGFTFFNVTPSLQIIVGMRF